MFAGCGKVDTFGFCYISSLLSEIEDILLSLKCEQRAVLEAFVGFINSLLAFIIMCESLGAGCLPRGCHLCGADW